MSPPPLSHASLDGDSARAASSSDSPSTSHARTPVKGSSSKAFVLQPRLNSDSSNGGGGGGNSSNSNSIKPANRSDPRRSFLYLNQESSPTTYGDDSTSFTINSNSDSPRSGVQGSGRPYSPPDGLGRGTERSPPRQLRHVPYDAETSFFPMTSPLAIRKKKQNHTLYAEDGGEYDEGLVGQLPSSSPIIKPRKDSRGSRLGAQMGRTRSAQSTGLARSQSPGGGDVSFDSVSSSQDRARTTRQQASTSVLPLSLRDREAGHCSLEEEARDLAYPPHSSSAGDYEPASVPSSQAVGPDRAARVPSANLRGRLSRIHYNKGDSISTQAKPSWDVSETTATSRVSPVGRSIQQLSGQASNRSLISEYKRAEHASNEAGVAVEVVGGGIIIPPTTEKQTSGTNAASPRTAERRDLLLPTLNGMRIAVQSVVTSPTETFMRKGERRRLSQSPQQQAESRNVSESTKASSQTQTYPGWQQVPPPSESETGKGWEKHAVEERQKKPALVPKVNVSSSSSSPPVASSSQKPAEDSWEKEAGKKAASVRARLTDQEIVQLGAVEGLDPASLLSPNGQALSSKNILTIALQKAQSAVQLDGENSVREAILAYQQAVRLLEEVMDRVNPSNSSSSRRRSSREEERRRLKVIHDTYADRIRLLSIIYSPDGDGEEESGDVSGFDAEESFARRSPSPIPMRQEEAEEAPEVLQEIVPRISEPKEVEEVLKTRDSDQARRLKSQPSPARETLLEKYNSLQRSDSDRSFQSANGQHARTRDAASTLQAPVDRSRLSPQGGREDDVPVPPTPYFDIDPNLINGGDGDGGTFVTQLSSLDDHSPSFAPYSSFERGHSRSPVGRARGLSSLSNLPSASEISAKEKAEKGGLKHNSRRFLSVGSQSLLQDMLDSKPSSPSKEHHFEQGVETKERLDGQQAAGTADAAPSMIPPAQVESKSAATFQRSRALTLSQAGQRLVSSNVSGGTISQRRKMAADDFSETAGMAVNSSLTKSLAPSDTSNDQLWVQPDIGNNSSGLDEEMRLASQRFTAGRKRASSQPSNRRPSIPANFLLGHQPPPGSPHGPPPVPKIVRKPSMPLPPLVLGTSQQLQQQMLAPGLSAKGSTGPTSGGLASGVASLRFPSPAPSTSSGYHALGTPVTPLSMPWAGMSSGMHGGDAKASIMGDIFAMPLPSMQIGALPSYTSNSYTVTLPWVGITNSLPDPRLMPSMPTFRPLRPFSTMKALQMSIERGAYITKRLYLPRELWLQSGSRLLAIETKIRMADSITSGIEGIEQGGQFLLRSAQSSQPGLSALNASKFLKLLEDLEVLLVEVQNTLAKKLGFVEAVRGKKGNNSFNALGSKLTRSLDRMTANSKLMDSPGTYVDGLHRLFVRAQVLGDHLSTLERSKMDSDTSPTRETTEWDTFDTDPYATLPAELRKNIEVKLIKFSDFFANVVLRFVLRDVAILMDKSVKRNTVLLTE